MHFSVKRIIWKGIAFDLYLPNSLNSLSKGLFLLPGIPLSCGKNTTAENLARRGFIVLLPYYMGVCDSRGCFNFSNSVKTALRGWEFCNSKYFLNYLKDSKEKPLIRKIKWVYSANSFGAIILLASLKDVKVESSLLISPVVPKWFSRENTASLFKFLKSGYPFTFRTENLLSVYKDFSEKTILSKTNFLSQNQKVKKLMIIHGYKDKVVPLKDVKDFFKSLEQSINKVYYFFVPRGTHKSNTLLNDKVLGKIKRVFYVG